MFAAVETAGRYDLARIGGLESVAPSRPTIDDRRRFAVDRPHGVPSDDGLPETREPSRNDSSARLAEGSGSKRRPARHMRIDRGEDRRPPASHGQIASETLASRMFRWHAAAAPHLGLVGVAALILSGSLLYWFAFGQWPQASSSSDAPHGETTTQAEPSDAAEPDASVTVNAADWFGWATSPRMADATATPSASNESPAQPTQAGAIEGPALQSPLSSPAAPAAPMATSSNNAAAVWMAQPITPTPYAGPYPITPYPAFSFAVPAPVNVAERPVAFGSLAPR